MMKKKKEIMAKVRMPRTHQFFHLTGDSHVIRIPDLHHRETTSCRVGGASYLEESPDSALFRTSGVSSGGTGTSGTPESALVSPSEAPPSFSALSSLSEHCGGGDREEVKDGASRRRGRDPLPSASFRSRSHDQLPETSCACMMDFQNKSF